MSAASEVMAFLHLRRAIREHQALLDQAGSARRTLLRLARKLDAGTPFDQARAATYRARHAAMDQPWHAELNQRRALGRELLALAPLFDAVTTFEQRLELLNVNIADRTDITRGAGLVLIVAGYCREDSAARPGEEYCDGPLFNSVHLEIVITMASSTVGRAAADQALVNVFGAQAYRLFDQQPKLQLVTTPPTTTTGDKT